MPRMRRCVGSAILAVAGLTGLLAQTNLNQQISGQVTDPTGAVLPNASVTVTDEGTGLSRTVTSNHAGNYVVPSLPTGSYRIACEAAGFKKAVVDHNPLATNVSIEVNCALQVGSQSESVTVQGNAVVVEGSNGDVGYTITGEQAGELQLNGRNFTELLQMLPGVSTTYTDGFGLFGGFGAVNNAQSINGARGDTTTWNLDGADNKGNGGGGNNFVNINPNAIGEFRALTSNYSAEFGSSSGAVVNIAIRSGTKKFHGMLYEYWRNDELQAYSFASLSKPKLRWNNFGGNIGGPVILPGTRFNHGRDKLFFFYSEDLKILRQGTTATWTVPSAAMKSGNFGSTVIRDPITQVPYPNNVLPQSAINPSMQKLVNIYPSANSGTASFIFNQTQPTGVHEEIFKLDYNHNEKNQISFHVAHNVYRQLEALPNLIQYWREMPGRNVSIQWNHVVTPTLINVSQFTYSGNDIYQKKDRVPNPVLIKSFIRQDLGITIPTIYGASPDIPTVTISGYQALNAGPLQYNSLSAIFNWKDTLTKIVGNHTLKAGVLVWRNRKNQDNPPAINGAFTFNSGNRNPSSGNSISDALLGNFYQYQEYQGVAQGWFRFWQVEPWVQDDWKVSRRLTVNLGLRWNYMQPIMAALGNSVQFLPQYFNPAQAAVVNPSNGQIVSAPNPYNGLAIAGPGFPEAAKGRVLQYNDPAVRALFHDLPQGGAYTRWNNYSPRIGFAFDLTGRQTTVLRGGFGTAYERIQGNFIFSSINNAPFNPVATILNGNVQNPNQGATGPISVQTINNSHFLDMKDPRTLTWSLGIQRKLDGASMFTVSYVGSSASNLSYINNINQPALGYANTVFVPGTKTLANANATRPYAGYGNIQEFNTGANFIYNSLQSQYTRRMKHNGIVSAAFTWAKGRTDANTFNYQPEDSYNLRNDWGTSNYSRNKVFASSWVYPLPFWRGGGAWYRQAFGGWQINGTGLIQSGLPQNVTVSNTTSPGTAGAVGSGVRPDLVGDPYSGPAVNSFQLLNPAAFANPAASTFGNLGAFNVFMPGWVNFNGSVSKSFWIRERYKLDFKFNMYNVPNHMSVSDLNTASFNGTKVVNGVTVSQTANFGAVNGKTPPRTMEASLRLSF